MSEEEPTPPHELASTAIFMLGCAGLYAMLTWLGPDGFAPGYALFGLGGVVAMAVEDRFRGARRLPKVRVVGRDKPR